MPTSQVTDLHCPHRCRLLALKVYPKWDGSYHNRLMAVGTERSVLTLGFGSYRGR